MTKPELGTKRFCSNCSSKFYDLHKSPIVCPNCQTVFEPPKAGSETQRRPWQVPAAPVRQPEKTQAPPVTPADTTEEDAAAPADTNEDDIGIDEDFEKE
ncbi:MAG TPA: TIGR02300 family protein [Xanthobacteraceae bacterium]|nr:TIGR02300 family protein [Xanthobacteraceae bacterium]